MGDGIALEIEAVAGEAIATVDAWERENREESPKEEGVPPMTIDEGLPPELFYEPTRLERMILHDSFYPIVCALAMFTLCAFILAVLLFLETSTSIHALGSQ